MNGQPLADTVPVAITANAADRLAALFDSHHDRLYRLARRLAPSADEALDLVQETFLKAARAPMSIPHGFASEEAWLVRVLVNTQRDQWRKAAVRRRHNRDVCHSPAVDDRQEAILTARATVWGALQRLKPRRRAVVVMHELEGLTMPTIATLLGISAITARWHLSMGRRDLLRALTPQLGDADEIRQ